MRIRPLLAIACLTFVGAAAAAILLWLSRREISNIESRAETTNTQPRHARKPSPAVPLNGNKSREESSVSESGSAGMTFAKQWPSEGVQMAAHHKGRRGCKGILTLKASGLQFTCPEDDAKSFFITLNDIRGPDDDGIATLEGSKYHFDMLPGGGKEYTEQLFAAWLSRVRVAPPPHQ